MLLNISLKERVNGVRLVQVLGPEGHALLNQGDHVVDVDVLGGLIVAVGFFLVGKQLFKLGHHADELVAPVVGNADVGGVDAGGVVAVAAVAEQRAAHKDGDAVHDLLAVFAQYGVTVSVHPRSAFLICQPGVYVRNLIAFLVENVFAV